jgi:phage shock protein C
MQKLTRTDKSDSMLFGVCGGLARHFGIDATLVRIIVALLTVFSFGGLLLAYIIMAIIMPKEI